MVCIQCMAKAKRVGEGSGRDELRVRQENRKGEGQPNDDVDQYQC